MSSLSEEERADLVAYLDGELDEEATQVLEAKLNLDPRLRAEVEAMRQTWGLLDYLPKSEPSPSFTHRTLEKLALSKPSGGSRVSLGVQRRAWWPRLAVAAAVLMAAGAGWGLGEYLGGPAPDDGAAADAPMIQHLRVAEKWRYYENAEDLDFVRQLAQPDLFGDETEG